MSAGDGRARWRWRLLALVLGVAVAIGLDLALGLLLVPRDETVFRRPHPVYHHDLAPNRRAETRWGQRVYRMRTNSLGFRDAEPREVPLQAVGPRVVLLGDSFVEGIGIDFEKSFAGLLAARGAESGVEVLNAGVVGYSPNLYARKLRHLLETVGLQFDALVVFVDNSDIPNEIVYESWPGGDPSWIAALWREARRRSFALHVITGRREASTRIRWNAAGMPFADDLDARVFDDPEFLAGGRWTESYKYAERGLALADSHMEEVVELCRTHGIRLTIVVYPWPKNVVAGDLDHVQVRHWRRFSALHGADFIELYGAFSDHASRPGASVRDFYIAGDMHWNERGHALVAELVWPVIDPQRR